MASTTSLASQLSKESSRTSRGDTGHPRPSSSGCHRMRHKTMFCVLPVAGKLHKLGSVPQYLRQNRPASSPAIVEQQQQLQQDSGLEMVSCQTVDPILEPVGKEEPPVFHAPKIVQPKLDVRKLHKLGSVPEYLSRNRPASSPAVVEQQNEVIEELTSRIEELHYEQVTLTARVDALEKQLSEVSTGKLQQEVPKESKEVRNYREAMLANVRKQDDVLVSIRETFLNWVCFDRQKRGTLDQVKLQELMKQLKQLSLEMRQLGKPPGAICDETLGGEMFDKASMQNLLDLGFEEKITGRIVYDKDIKRF